MKRYFVFKNDKSDKFWSIEIEGTLITIVFGKRGSAGNTNIKEFFDEHSAHREADNLVRAKLKKGYVEVFDDNAGVFGEIEFWNMIERAKSKAESTEEQAEILIEMLSQRSESDIIEFAKYFHQIHTMAYQSNLWAAAYIINGGCSDDGFDYFRGWLIAQGKDIFQKTLQNPEYLTKIIKPEEADEIDGEFMLYVANEAYNHRTGEEIPQDMIHHILLPDITLDWSEEGDDLKNKYPKLWKKYARY